MSQFKETTIYDIAEKLNVSATTVSRGLKDDPAISKKTRKRISDMAEKLGYRTNHFARNLRNRNTKTIGVIVSKLNSHFQSSVLSGIAQVTKREGYNLLISQTFEQSDDEALSARTMFDSRVDGLLVSLAYDTRDLQHFESFFKKKIPVIFFDRVLPHDQCMNIVIDNRMAAYQVTKHLIEQGCRNIVHITAPLLRNVYVDRLKGYKDALSEANITFNEQNVMINNLTMEDGKEAAELILNMTPLPDAVFATNDSCAVGCMLALKNNGINIPGDIAFAGFNNDPVSLVVEPNLTTIHYHGHEMGAVAARYLVNHLNGTAPIDNTNSIVLRSELIVRQSSKKKTNQ